jgi:serine/threonine protein kinase
MAPERTERDWHPAIVTLASDAPHRVSSRDVAKNACAVSDDTTRRSNDETLAAPNVPLPVITGYEVTRLLGEGGMASVYLATDPKLKRQVAVKMMSSTLGADPQFRARFAFEAQVVAALRHPNIVTVFASGEADGRNYIVMEYVPGGTLADRLATGPLDSPTTIAITRGLLRALVYAHERGIVHRDVKPGNVLFTSGNEPVLSDFGIAKLESADTSRTRTGAVIGSPKYMAPEQLSGLAATDRVDVYSLALVVLEMLTGKVPPRGVTSIREGRDVSALARYLPGQLKRWAPFLGQCLRAEPADRPSAVDALVALEVLATKRAPRWPIPVAAAALALIGSAVWFGTNRMPDAPALSTTRADEPVQRSANADEPVSTRNAVVPATAVTQTPGQSATFALPTFTEFSEFSAAFDADAPVGGRPPSLDYAPYNQLMALRARKAVGGDDAIANDIARLRERAERGDAEAQLMLFLAADGKLIDDSPELVSWLESSAKAGNGLASYYYALLYRSQHERDGELDPASLRELRELYRRAEEQGLGFADAAVAEANQLLGAP